MNKKNYVKFFVRCMYECLSLSENIQQIVFMAAYFPAPFFKINYWIGLSLTVFCIISSFFMLYTLTDI